jgi:hypothetical protein
MQKKNNFCVLFFRKKLNILKSYVHRYFRITPVLAAAILFVVTLFKYLGDGPVWNAGIDFTIRSCQDYWWSALLHVQNYVNPVEIVREYLKILIVLAASTQIFFIVNF